MSKKQNVRSFSSSRSESLSSNSNTSISSNSESWASGSSKISNRSKSSKSE
jgi:hypothetical protein